MEELLKRARPGMRIASMGYPDIIITPDEVTAITGGAGLEYLPMGVSKRHGVSYKIPEAIGFFKSIGIELDVYDITTERGFEIKADLNFPLEPGKSYDIVIDVGTLEHCFNIGQALINMASLVGEGGYILHENPYNWGNHGFYNLNPTLFNDFYTQNGFEIIDCVLLEKNSMNVHQVPLTARFNLKGGECNLITVARCNKVQELGYPVQTKYKGASK